MPELLADRFVPSGRTWVDIASGAPVRLVFSTARDASRQLVWDDQCSERARLRHPLLNPLIDYGLLGSDRLFEAYAAGDSIALPGGQAARTLRHVTRFLESRGLPLTADLSRVALRSVSAVLRTSSPSNRDEPRKPRLRGPTLGVVLQPRAILEGFREALDGAGPGGTTSVEICGGRGAGLRTAQSMSARIARLAGFVPVASTSLVRLPWLRDELRSRHVCVFLEDHDAGERATLATFLASLGVASSRRHVLLRFNRTDAVRPGAQQIDGLGITAMTSMVFAGEDGPSYDEIFDAARGAGGRPGLFLERLRATGVGESMVRADLVHESVPAYVLEAPSPPRTRDINRVLRDAAERGARLAARGRHASAIRLLSRASRVLEAREEAVLAAACAEQLAWVFRGRGHSDLALRQFERARTLVQSAHTGRRSPRPDAETIGLQAAIGIGIVWTDQRRFHEAEAALRAAYASATILASSDLTDRARLGLARCLYWHGRHDEAAAELREMIAKRDPDRAGIEAWSLMARARAASSDLRGALAAAHRALDGLDAVRTPRIAAHVLRSMAVVQQAAGDGTQQRLWSERALHAATLGRLPLAALRARCLFVDANAGRPDSPGRPDRPDSPDSNEQRLRRWLGHLRGALERRPLPELIRQEIEAARQTACRVPAAGSATLSERALLELEKLLQLAQSAPSDSAAAEAVCAFVLERSRASGAQIITAGGEPRVLARAGRSWACEPMVAVHAATIHQGRRLGSDCFQDQHIAAEAVRWGDETPAVFCCRWSLGTAIDRESTAALLRAATLAVAPSVRAVLEAPTALAPDATFSELIGASEGAVALRAAIQRAARAPYPVLIEGESGSGKELVARGVHRLGARRDRRLCTVNCAALSDDLLEAELFGHARGAFTGAVGERAGLFEDADGGTLFLDEVGELSARAQAKLLRVLQDGEIRRVGENLSRRVDARIVAATNRRLEDEVSANRFRADLRFRLDVVRIVVPPLRERATDIPALATRFWADAANRVGTTAALSAEAVAALARYDWPGNIRELQNVIAALAVHAPRRGRILPSLLPVHIARCGANSARTFEAAREEFERRFVRAALAGAGGQRARAARTLGLSRQGLAKMLKRLGIDDPC
jgi:DNA-binding NtrC family response regulator/tetratricopeptide (TPR) repeat protein